MEDWKLIRDYVDKGSETAFTTLVNRHLSLVYSTALRRSGVSHTAEEIAQAVFCLLAQKAHTLRSETALAGWLHQTVCHLTAKHWRTEYRRRQREQEAIHMSTPPSDTDATWDELAPFVDEAMAQLPEEDHLAILLRFFQNKPFIQIGISLGVSEDAARMRVNRALEKLRQALDAKKLACTTAVLGALLMEHSAIAVPATAAAAIHSAALKAVQPASSISFLATVLAQITATKLKTVAGICLGLTILMLGLHFSQSQSRQQQWVRSKAPVESSNNSTASLPPNRHSTPINRRSLPSASGKNSPAPPQTNLAQEQYELGEKLQREKKYDEALVAYSKAVELLDQGAEHWFGFTDLYFSRAALYSERKDYSKAIADYTRMLEFEPKRFDPLFNRALYYTIVGKTTEAIADYTTILTDPDVDFSLNVGIRESIMASSYENRGKVYQERKDYGKAIADYNEALRLDPLGNDGMIVYWRRGTTYEAMQRLDKAAEDADFMSAQALALIMANKPNSEEAGKALDITIFACRIFKQPSPYHLEARAAALAHNGKFDEAISYQQKALDTVGQIPQAELLAMHARLEIYQSRNTLQWKQNTNR